VIEPFCVAMSTLCIPAKVNAVFPVGAADVIGPTEINARFVAPPFAVEMVGSPTSCNATNLNAATGTFPPYRRSMPAVLSNGVVAVNAQAENGPSWVESR
jgi:hypothetical protein